MTERGSPEGFSPATLGTSQSPLIADADSQQASGPGAIHARRRRPTRPTVPTRTPTDAELLAEWRELRGEG